MAIRESQGIYLEGCLAYRNHLSIQQELTIRRIAEEVEYEQVRKGRALLVESVLGQIVQAHGRS